MERLTYKCFKCGKEFQDPKKSRKEPLVEKCPGCHSTLTKVIKREQIFEHIEAHEPKESECKRCSRDGDNKI